LLFSTSQGSDKFYYGGFHVQGLYGKCPELKDSLRFNIVHAMPLESTTIDSVGSASLQAIADQPQHINSPTYWGGISRYTKWEAEGFLGSRLGFTYHGGSLVSDSLASGGKARLFKPLDDQAGLIQEGPGYDQEPGALYTAEFRIKSPLTYEPRSGGPSPPICSLKVVGNGQLLAHKMVYKSDFWNFYGYKTFKINYYATQNPIEFQIYWYGNRRLYIDYVKVSDANGQWLMSGGADSAIIAYVSQDWVKTTIPETGDTVVYRWYLKDEPWSIDHYEPYRYIDSLLKSVSEERAGFQASLNAQNSR
jgi:hypothetical protein